MSSDEEVLCSIRSQLNDACTSEVDATLEECEVCDLPVAPCDRSMHKLFGRSCLHKPCYNGSRALERISQKDSKVKEQVVERSRSNPMKFEAIAVSLVTQSVHSRKAADRAEVFTCILILTRENSVSRLKDSLLLPKDEYIAYMILNKRMSEAQAKQAWKDDLQNPDVMDEVEDGRRVVPVRLPTRVRGEEKISEKREFEQIEGDTSVAKARKHLRGNRSNKFGSRDFSSVGGGVLATGASSSGGKVVEFIVMGVWFSVWNSARYHFGSVHLDIGKCMHPRSAFCNSGGRDKNMCMPRCCGFLLSCI